MTQVQIPSMLTHTFSTLAVRKKIDKNRIFRAISETQKLQTYPDNEEKKAHFPKKPN